MWKYAFLRTCILAIWARATARVPIYYTPMNSLINLDAFWLLGRNHSWKTRCCRSIWTFVKIKNEHFWKFSKIFNFLYLRKFLCSFYSLSKTWSIWGQNSGWPWRNPNRWSKFSKNRHSFKQLGNTFWVCFFHFWYYQSVFLDLEAKIRWKIKKCQIHFF